MPFSVQITTLGIQSVQADHFQERERHRLTGLVKNNPLAMGHVHACKSLEISVILAEFLLEQIALQGLVHATVQRQFLAGTGGVLLHGQDHLGKESAHMRHGIGKILLNQPVHIRVRVGQQVCQHKGIALLYRRIEITAAVEENALDAPAQVFLEALLHHIQDGVRGKIVIKIADVVPYIYGIGVLFPLLQFVQERLGALLVPGTGIVDGAQEHAHVLRQRMRRKSLRGGVSRQEELMAGKTAGQFFNEGDHRRRGVGTRIAQRLAATAFTYYAVVIGADGNAHVVLAAVPILVQDKLHREFQQTVRREAELVLVDHAGRTGEEFRIHVLVAEGLVSVGTQYAGHLVPPDAPVHLQVMQAQQKGHVRILVAGHVQVPVFEGEGRHGILLWENAGRQVVHGNGRIVRADVLDELIGEPNHGALVTGRQLVTVFRVFHLVVSAHIIAHVERHVHHALPGRGGQESLPAHMQMLPQIIRGLAVRQADFLGMDVIADGALLPAGRSARAQQEHQRTKKRQ